MADKYVTYDNPLVARYASKEMTFIWSPQKKFSTWRRLWLALAESEKECGLTTITDEQLDEMRANLENIDFDVANAKEKELKHDVMAHIHAFGTACPKAMPIIHLGATSCFVGDNTDIVQMHEAMQEIQKRLLKLMSLLGNLAKEHRALPQLGFTHYQPAQLVTVGKRVSLWLQDFLFDHESLETFMNNLPMRGVKGTTGTQATFLDLFDGDHEKVRDLDRRVVKKMGFKKSVPVSGQTYTRKLDHQMANILSGIAASAHKMATDVRLLMNLKEVDEPFETKQVGSSAMAYKRNPMRSERICSLARFVMSLPDNCAHTHANQWFERTLDDSANRRLVLPQACLAIDAILALSSNVVDGMQVWPLVVHKHIMAELPFMATENILMACVRAGGDRQDLHEAIREHSMEAGRLVKQEGKDNDLLERIAKDPRFKAIHADMGSLLDPSKFIGRCPEQVDEFLAEEVNPVLSRLGGLIKLEHDGFKL